MRLRVPSSDREFAGTVANCRVLIICYGNPLRCDDGLAWRAAEQLAETFSAPDVKVMSCHQLAPELCQDLHQANTVFFIDAARYGMPGELRFLPVAVEKSAAAISHDATPAGLLHLCESLWGTAPRGFLVTLSGACFDYGETLSPQVVAQLPHLTDVIAKAVNRLGHTSSRSLSIQP